MPGMWFGMHLGHLKFPYYEYVFTKVQDSNTPCKARVSPTKRLHTSENSLPNGEWNSRFLLGGRWSYNPKWWKFVMTFYIPGHFQNNVVVVVVVVNLENPSLVLVAGATRIFWSCKCSLEDYSGGMSLTCHMSCFIKSFRISRPTPFDLGKSF